MLYRMLMFLGAIGLIWFSGNQVVDVVTTISRELHITTTLLGLTLTGVATSLPELLTAVTASLKRENKIVIGTVLGSNIFNLTLFPAIVFGTIGTWFITYSQFFSLLVSTGIFAWMLLRFRGKPIPKVYGIYLLFVYAIFLISSIFFQGTT